MCIVVIVIVIVDFFKEQANQVSFIRSSGLSSGGWKEAVGCSKPCDSMSFWFQRFYALFRKCQNAPNSFIFYKKVWKVYIGSTALWPCHCFVENHECLIVLCQIFARTFSKSLPIYNSVKESISCWICKNFETQFHI